MATSKEYAYYVKGNRIAVVQKDWTFSGGQTLSQPGLNDLGTMGALLWKSPVEDVTNGIELQYVHSPDYSLGDNHSVNVNKFYISGWTVIGGYLTFLRGATSNSDKDWTSSPENAVTSGSLGDTGGNSLDYILIRDSSRWNGLHRVQTAGSNGQLKTYTKVNEVLPYFENIAIDWNSTNKTVGYGAADDVHHFAEYFSTGDYIWTSGSTSDTNTGLFSVTGTTPANIANQSLLTLGTKYWIPQKDVSDTTISMSYSDEGTTEVGSGGISDLTTDTNDTSCNIYKAYRDHSYLLTNINVLNDESDEVDVTRYQGNALVYYLKARYAEDAGNIEGKEYFMREFRRMVEKHESNKVIGPRRMQGFSHFSNN